MRIILVLFVGVLVPLVFSQDETFSGPCPSDVTVVPGFQQAKFEGRWYEIQRYHKSETMDCIEETYDWEAFDALAGKYTVERKERNLEKNQDYKKVYEMVQTYRHQGKYFVPETNYWPLWVIDTDYTNYAVIWGCWDEFTPDKSNNKQRLTVLARSRNFQMVSSPGLTAILRKSPFDTSKLKVITQSEKCYSNDGAVDDPQVNKENVSSTLNISAIFSTILMTIICKYL